MTEGSWAWPAEIQLDPADYPAIARVSPESLTLTTEQRRRSCEQLEELTGVNLDSIWYSTT